MEEADQDSTWACEVRVTMDGWRVCLPRDPDETSSAAALCIGRSLCSASSSALEGGQ